MERCCNYGDWLDSLEALYTTLARIPVFDEDSLVSYRSCEMREERTLPFTQRLLVALKVATTF